MIPAIAKTAEAEDAPPAQLVIGPIASIVAGFVAFGMTRGLSGPAILQAAGLEFSDLSDPDRYLPASSMFALWRLYLDKLGDPALPVHLAETFPVENMGLVAQLAKCSATVQGALQQMVRHSRLAARHLLLSLVSRGGNRALSLTHHARFEELGGPVEFTLALVYRSISLWLGAPLALREVTFKHAARTNVGIYEDFFGAPVTFGAAGSELVLPASVVEAPLLAPEPGVVRYLEAHAGRLLAALPPAEAAIVGQVREALSREMLNGQTPQDHIARKLGLSARTLQRRLLEAGTTFADLLDDMRRVNALRLLTDRATTITDTAFLLGYSDVPTFHRAFKRWTGQTPQKWREGSKAA